MAKLNTEYLKESLAFKRTVIEILGIFLAFSAAFYMYNSESTASYGLFGAAIVVAALAIFVAMWATMKEMQLMK